MAFEAENKALVDAMISCKVADIDAAVQKALDAKMDPNAIIDAMGDGMTEVGKLFERGRLFLPHVLSAAAGMKKAMGVLEPMMSNEASTANTVAVVMGTVEGDVHDIGKSICSTMLQCAGFEVHDLGRDVPTPEFIKEIQGGCKFCGMSALMTTTMTVMQTIIDITREGGYRDSVVMMVGGAPVTQAYADKIGADIYGESASETTNKAKTLAF